MDEYVSNLNQGGSLRLELERTRVAYQALLDEMNEQSYHLPSINPAWRIGELLYHIISAVRFLPQDVRMMRSGRMITPPAWLYNFFNVWFTRLAGRRQNCSSLAAEYDRRHEVVLALLESIKEEEWGLSDDYPDVGGAMDGGRRTLADMFHYLTLHFEEHAAEIHQSMAASIQEGDSSG